MFNFGRHTVTQGLMALEMTDGDSSGWYRPFSRGRDDDIVDCRVMLRETIKHTAMDEPYVVGVDGMKAPRTPVFKMRIHRAQWYVHGAWLMPMEAGYSRAIPLRFLSAFLPKAKPAADPPQQEWEARSAFLHWG